MKLTHFIYLQITIRWQIKHFTVTYGAANNNFWHYNWIFFAAKKSPYLRPNLPICKPKSPYLSPGKYYMYARVENQYGTFCPPRRICVGCFVHPVKTSLGSFVHGIFCPTFVLNGCAMHKKEKNLTRQMRVSVFNFVCVAKPQMFGKNWCKASKHPSSCCL